jgi:hypothetical protein
MIFMELGWNGHANRCYSLCIVLARSNFFLVPILVSNCPYLRENFDISLHKCLNALTLTQIAPQTIRKRNVLFDMARSNWTDYKTELVLKDSIVLGHFTKSPTISK